MSDSQYLHIQVQLFVAGKTTFNMLGNIRINNRYVLLICLQGCSIFVIMPLLHSEAISVWIIKQRIDENIFLCNVESKGHINPC